MRGIATLLLLAVAVLCGYTYLHVSHFESRIKKLEAKAVKLEARAPAYAAGGDTRILLKQAAESCRRAKVYLDRGQTSKAKRELDTSIDKLAQASKSAEGGGQVRELTEVWKKIKAQMDRLWKQFAKESKKD